MKKIIVTGGTGFMGRSIKQALHDQNFNNVITTSRKKLNGFFITNDFCHLPKADILIHAAGPSDRHIVNSFSEEEIDRECNKFKNLFSTFEGKIVLLSSASVYGASYIEGSKETDKTIITDNYTLLKCYAENICLKSGGLVIRLTNLVGKHMSPNNVVSRILSQNHINMPLSVQDTSPIRDFLWHEDAAEIITKLALNDFKGIYNIGSGTPISIFNLCKIYLKHLNQSHREIICESKKPSNSILTLNINKIFSDTGWKPKKTLLQMFEILTSTESKQRLEN